MDRLSSRLASCGLPCALTSLVVSGRVLRLACAGRQIADATTGEQHFDQEGQQRPS